MSEQSDERKQQIRKNRMALRFKAKLQLFGQTNNLDQSLSRSKKIMHQSKSSLSSSRISDKMSDSIKKSKERKNQLANIVKKNQIDISEKYEDLNDLLGDGVSGCVKKYRHKENGKIYAVKEIRGHEEKKILAINTYKLQRKLKHPYICQTYNLYINEEQGCLYQTMEYCSDYISLDSFQQQYQEKQQKKQTSSEQLGEEQQKKKRPQVPIEITKIIIKSLVEAVHYMHEKGVCHRDLKPDNILINKHDPSKIRIIDFGIARRYLKTNPDNQFIKMYIKLTTQTGTLVYKAPEMFSRYTYTQSVDMWSIGIITYQLLTGRVPFWNSYKTETIELIENCEVPFDESIFEWSNHIEIKDFVNRLLKKEPKEDIHDFDILNDQYQYIAKQSRRMTAQEAKIHIWFSQCIPKLDKRIAFDDIQILGTKETHIDVNQSTPNVLKNRNIKIDRMDIKQSRGINIKQKEEKSLKQQTKEMELLRKKMNQLNQQEFKKGLNINNLLQKAQNEGDKKCGKIQEEEQNEGYSPSSQQFANFFDNQGQAFPSRFKPIDEPQVKDPHNDQDISLTTSIIPQQKQKIQNEKIDFSSIIKEYKERQEEIDLKNSQKNSEKGIVRGESNSNQFLNDFFGSSGKTSLKLSTNKSKMEEKKQENKQEEVDTENKQEQEKQNEEEAEEEDQGLGFTVGVNQDMYDDEDEEEEQEKEDKGLGFTVGVNQDMYDDEDEANEEEEEDKGLGFTVGVNQDMYDDDDDDDEN